MLQVVVQIFIGIVFRRIGRQEKERDPVLVRFHPLLHLIAVMHLQIVDDKEDLVRDVLDQGFHEMNHAIRIHGIRVQQKVQLPPVADRRNHIDVHLDRLNLQNRRLTLGCIASRIVRFVLDSRLISPEDFCLDNAYEVLEKEEVCSEEPVEQGWINRFFDSVADVSNEDLQKLWGQLLAGETKKPGSFSLKTLDILKNLRPQDAQLFQSILPFTIKNGNARFITCMNEMHSITERDAFSYGFRLGAQLMAESFLLPVGEEE